MVKTRGKFSSRIYFLPALLFLLDVSLQKGASDPLNPIKLWILIIAATWATAELITSFEVHLTLKSKFIRFYAILLLTFSFFMFIAFLKTDVKIVGFLGDTGRNIGFLNYFLLAILAFYASVTFNNGNLKVIYKLVAIVFPILIVYGFLQHYKHDFIKWNNPYNPIILMTGNPDFAASLLAIYIVLSFSILFVGISKIYRIVCAISIVLASFLVYLSQARQGLIDICVGIGFFLVVYLWEKKRELAITLASLGIFVGAFSVLGMLQVGPLTKYFFKSSITDRGYNWRAAIAMFKSHPYFGVGLDRYGANFLTYRDAKYPLLFGYTQNVTNAHNVFLQYFATCGIFVGIFYLLLLIFTGYRAFIALKYSSGRERTLIAGIISAWLVYIAQSVVSIDNLSISIWGWITSGVIIGLSIQEPKNFSERVFSHISHKDSIKVTTRNYFRISIFIFGVFIMLISIISPMYKNETGVFRFAQVVAPKNSQENEIYLNYAKKIYRQRLMNPSQRTYIAWTAATHGAISEAIPMLKDVLATDPKNINCYTMIALSYEALGSNQEAITYRQKLSVLDPYGADNLLNLEKDFLAVGDKGFARKTRDSIVAMAPGTDIAKQAQKLLS